MMSLVMVGALCLIYIYIYTYIYIYIYIYIASFTFLMCQFDSRVIHDTSM